MKQTLRLVYREGKDLAEIAMEIVVMEAIGVIVLWGATALASGGF